MAAGWLHQTVDLIAYGRTYAHVHRGKDAAAQMIPGARHRNVGHEWYQRFGQDWDFNEAYPQAAKEVIKELGRTCGPDMAEERMSSDSHDLIDRRWDGLPKDERLYWEGFFAWLVYHPEHLLSWAGVDVVHGRIKRCVNGKAVWETAPEVVYEYEASPRGITASEVAAAHCSCALWAVE
jgi:hypothetical protein